MKELAEKEKAELTFWTKKSIYSKRIDERGQPSKRIFKRYHEILSESISNLSGKVVVDIGCGPMGSLHFFPALLKIGIDPLSSHYQEAFKINEKQRMSYISAHAESIPLRNGVADYIFCINAIDHVDDPDKTALEIIRILRPGGKLFVLVEVNKPSATQSEPHVLSSDSIYDMFIPALYLKHTNLVQRHKMPWMLKRWWFTDWIGFYPRYHDLFIASFQKPISQV